MKLVLFSSGIIGVSAVVNCQNGWLCPDKTTCTSTAMGAGGKFMCTSLMAGSSAQICQDSRFSCPSNYTCDVQGMHCKDKSSTFIQVQPLLYNGHAKRAPNKASSNGLVCDIIGSYLPSFCTCTDTQGGLAGHLACEVAILGLETVDVLADIEPCNNPMDIKLEVTESDFGIDWKYELNAGDDEEIAIPGLSIDIPGLASAGVFAALELNGNIDNLEIKLGIDVCGDVPIFGQECGSDISSSLPIWILDENFNFGSTCSGIKLVNKTFVFQKKH